MRHAEAQAFFESYRDAFNRLDGDAVADLWHTPSGITDNHGPDGAARLTWWADEAPMRANHRALCDVYAQADYGHAEFSITDHLALGANHALTQVDWTLRRRDASVLQRFATGYQLIRTGRGLRVLLCVAHAEHLKEMTPHAAQ